MTDKEGTPGGVNTHNGDALKGLDNKEDSEGAAEEHKEDENDKEQGIEEEEQPADAEEHQI